MIGILLVSHPHSLTHSLIHFLASSLDLSLSDPLLTHDG